jgi:ATP-dependent Clp endopeptidase proteolytic subunit ClpP
MSLDPQNFTRRLRAHQGRSEERIRNQAPPAVVSEDGTATLRLYDPIDSWGEYWGVSAKEFAQTLDELPDTVTRIELHVNSPGGDVFDGIAIMNALRAHAATVTVIVDGIAASAASFIAASADTLIMAPNSELMIHDAWGLVVGNAADMKQMAELLDHLSNNIASVYARKAGGSTEDWRAAMQRESWFSAEEALAAGLADQVDGADATNSFDLSIFTYAGRTSAPAPVVDSTPESHEPAPPPGETDRSDPQSTPSTPRLRTHLRAQHAMTKENT